MTTLGWLVFLAPIILTFVGYYWLHNIKKYKRDEYWWDVIAAILSLLTGVVGGYLAFMPLGWLCFTIYPNEPHGGHIGMPMGQIFCSIALSVIFGIVTAIVANIKIMKWQKRG
jgi:hypothetical protein